MLTFKEIREQGLVHRAALDELERICEREWICPDKLKIRVTVVPGWPDDPASLFVERFVPQEGCTHTLRNGTVIEGGYYDHFHEAHRYLTAQQLRWMATARTVVDGWIAGEIAELPHALTF